MGRPCRCTGCCHMPLQVRRPGAARALCHDAGPRCALQRRTGPSGSIASSWGVSGKTLEVALAVRFVLRTCRAVNWRLQKVAQEFGGLPS
jgi:hypothetical protein